MTIFETDPKPMRLRSGEDHSLEEEAAAWLAKSREGVTALCDKRDYLTRDQLMLRWSKEITNSTGVVEESLSPGLFRRVYNPLAGHRPRRANSEE
jgi:hypothetical protein